MKILIDNGHNASLLVPEQKDIPLPERSQRLILPAARAFQADRPEVTIDCRGFPASANQKKSLTLHSGSTQNLSLWGRLVTLLSNTVILDHLIN